MPESLFIGWVNITGMEGQHKTEWWVNMLRNLHYYDTKVKQVYENGKLRYPQKWELVRG